MHYANPFSSILIIFNHLFLTLNIFLLFSLNRLVLLLWSRGNKLLQINSACKIKKHMVEGLLRYRHLVHKTAPLGLHRREKIFNIWQQTPKKAQNAQFKIAVINQRIAVPEPEYPRTCQDRGLPARYTDTERSLPDIIASITRRRTSQYHRLIILPLPSRLYVPPE